MRVSAFTWGCLLCVLVAACAIKNYGEPQVLTEEMPLGKIRAESDGFVAELEDQPEPNQFKMKLSWPDFEGDLRFAVIRVEGDKEKSRQVLANLLSPAREYVDDKIEPNKAYRYELSVEKKVGLNYLPHDSRSVFIRTFSDYELVPKGDPIPNGRYHRVFFRKNTRLDVAEDLLIMADEFIVESNFQIHYWPEGGGKTIPILYDLALITAIATGDDPIKMVNEFLPGGGVPSPAVLLESRKGEPFAVEEKDKKNRKLCIRTPKLNVWSPSVCNDISVRLRKKAQ